MAYRLVALDEGRVLGKLSRLGGTAPVEMPKETLELSEPEGTLKLKTRNPIIILELKYEDGASIASCSLSRMDPRSAKKNTYSFEDEQSSSPICGALASPKAINFNRL